MRSNFWQKRVKFAKTRLKQAWNKLLKAGFFFRWNLKNIPFPFEARFGICYTCWTKKTWKAKISTFYNAKYCSFLRDFGTQLQKISRHTLDIFFGFFFLLPTCTHPNQQNEPQLFGPTQLISEKNCSITSNKCWFFRLKQLQLRSKRVQTTYQNGQNPIARSLFFIKWPI